MKPFSPLILSLVLAWSGAACAAPSPDKYPIKGVMPDLATVPIIDHDLGHGVHMLESFGGNIGVLAGPNGTLLVDAEYPELSGRLRAAVARISPLPVRYVVNTHFHWDHAGGNAAWTGAGAVVISSEETWKHISDAQADPSRNKAGQYRPDPAALPVLTVGQGATLHLGAQKAEIIHLAPAHTDGDLIVRFPEADIIQTGDTFFGHFYPSIDVAHGGSVDGLLDWYERLYAMSGPNTKIIPGHGPVQTREDIRVFQIMMREVRARVAKAIAAGMTLDQLVAAHPLDDLDKDWGGNLIQQPQILSSVYRSLIEKAAHAGQDAAR
ncbi:MBL fold metallo-hydrolase [Sphingobium boeckii]|uniref:Glyoxylase-like metal-dependent hydrolase (Beta-lactamase superfamily II) n=1 Tax=Sphingobium boeckii TaxID=1082345 RepID=A0A7W9EEK8_9SPHN|nr:MBL fold metallo-hydrolase [Sphingobium boeckii]MBB5684786.1 glyoxylase-like metal-dependent hydrolase (beta-lactamase superfamily II) [Sphingobium boeckii]